MLLKVLYKEKEKYIVRYINSLREIEMTKQELLEYIRKGIVINARASKSGRIYFKDDISTYKFMNEVTMNIPYKSDSYWYELGKSEVYMEGIQNKYDIDLECKKVRDQLEVRWQVIDRKTKIKMPGSMICEPQYLAEYLLNECKNLTKYIGADKNVETT